MPYIKVVQPEDAEGQLKEVYEHIISSRGKIAEVHKIQSLNPQTIIDHMNLYMTVMYGQSPLKRVVRELLGVVVSKANQCVYCVTHHVEAVNHYWKDDERMKRMMSDFRTANLSPKELILCEFAEKLTLDPGATQDGVEVQKLKSAGIDDREILDTAGVVAYFNYVNRLVLSLGVYLEDDGGSGYNYE